MNYRIVLFATLALFGSAGIGFSQTASPTSPGPPSTAVPVVMTMGDLMDSLVQPRHLKLGVAGQSQLGMARLDQRVHHVAHSHYIGRRCSTAGGR